MNVERANKGTPVGLKARARKKAELSTLNYSSPIRRHQEQRQREKKRERERQNPTQPHKNPLTQPSSQLQMGHITLFPEKIYLSIFLEPRQNNNILQEKRHKYPTIPHTVFWDLLENFQQKLLLRGSSFRKGQGHEPGSVKLKKKKNGEDI